MTEYVSGELGGKIKAIICEWSKRLKEGTEPDQYLQSSTIYERLISVGVEVPDHAMSEILVELARAGKIKLTSLLKKSMSARSAVQKRPETRPKHYENVVFSPWFSR